jgi:NAD+ kinase
MVSSCKNDGFFRKEAADIHTTVADQVIDEMKQSGRKVKVARDFQLQPSDFDNIDLVMSLGGDGTFLKTASMISSNKLPIFGVNTDPSRSVGHLTSIPIRYKERERTIPLMVDFINRENFKFRYKQRIKLTSQSQVSESVSTVFSLNEVFVAERNVGSSSVY